MFELNRCAAGSTFGVPPDAHLSAGDEQRPVLADGAAEHGAVAQVQAALNDRPCLLVIPRAAVLVGVAERTELLVLRRMPRARAFTDLKDEERDADHWMSANAVRWTQR